MNPWDRSDQAKRREDEEARRCAVLREERLKTYVGEILIVAVVAALVMAASLAWQHLRNG